MKKRNRKVTGRFLTTNRLPKENPTLDEITKGQKEEDVRRLSKQEQAAGSAYWGWMAQHGQQTEDGEIIETPLANPDILAEGAIHGSLDEDEVNAQREYTLTRKAISEVLTEQQRHVMMLIIDGFSQDKIAHNLGITRQRVNSITKSARKRLEKYLRNNVAK